MLKQILAMSMLAFALACAGSGSGGGGAGEGGFGPEGDQGLGGPGNRGGAEDNYGLRTIYFDYDADALREDAKSTLRQNAQVLKEGAQLKVEIQGNCDERGSEEYNLALGMRRAESAKRYLQDLGVDTMRLSTISFGEENPAVRSSNEAAWAKNRRDDFVVR